MRKPEILTIAAIIALCFLLFIGLTSKKTNHAGVVKVKEKIVYHKDIKIRAYIKKVDGGYSFEQELVFVGDNYELGTVPLTEKEVNKIFAGYGDQQAKKFFEHCEKQYIKRYIAEEKK